MNDATDRDLVTQIAEELGKDCSRQCLETEPDYYGLFAALVRNVGLAKKKDERGIVEQSEINKGEAPKDEEARYLDYYCCSYMRVTDKDSKFDDFKKCIESFDDEFIPTNWRRFGVNDRKISEKRAEIFICCSAFVHGRSLKRHLAEFFSYCRLSEKIKLTCLDEFQDEINALITEELGPKKAPSPDQPHLTIPDSKEGNPNYYANALLDVIGRDTEKKRLEEFLNCDLNVAWFQLAGEAGQGKSRLAFDLIQHAANELGWSAGHLEEKNIRLFGNQWEKWQPDKPHLIVFDYVVGRVESIRSVFQTLNRRQAEFLHNVRILLVERQPWNQDVSFDESARDESDGSKIEFATESENFSEWFLNLCTDENDSAILKTRFEDGIVVLGTLGEDSLVKIVEQISIIISGKKPAISNFDIKETLQRIDKSGRPLYAYFLGQELAHGENTKTWSNTDLLRSVLARERKRWWVAAFKDRNKAPRTEDDIPASRLAILATMTDGLDCQEAYAKGISLEATAKDREQALALTGNPLREDIDGSPPFVIPPMQPDLLGEWYVIESLRQPWSPLKELTTLAWRYDPRKMAVFIRRVHQDFRDHDVTSAMLDCVGSEQSGNSALADISDIVVHHLYSNRREIPETIVQALQDASDGGNIRASSYLGVCYAKGIGVKKDGSKALKYLTHAANAGNAGAMLNLGIMYESGEGVKKDLARAIQLYQGADDLGVSSATRTLALHYFNGVGVKKNIEKAIELLKKAVDAGDAEAMLRLGWCYKTGNGVKKNSHVAFGLFKSAVEKGNTGAMVKLGGYYEDGIAVEKNINLALDYYKKAADAGEVSAMLRLGLYYREGINVEKDIAESIKYTKKAADAGDVEASLEMGSRYLEGIDVERDASQAKGYLKRAASAGNIKAIVGLAGCYLRGILGKTYVHKGAGLLREAEKSGEPLALLNLGTCYELGSGVEKDPAKAFYYYSLAAETGNADAFLKLAICFEDGFGTDKNLKRAIEYYKKSAQEGNSMAQTRLGFLCQEGHGVPQSDSQAFEYFRIASEADDLGGIHALGLCYECAVGIEKNFGQAIDCYTRAADLGNDESALRMGQIYEHGIEIEQDFSKAREYYLRAAEAGNATAMLNLGLLYDDVDYVDRDIQAASHWYKKAADARNPQAMRNLGNCYEFGHGVRKDIYTAIHYYRKARAADNIDAYVDLGACYEHGNGVERDPQKAFELYELAAKADNVIGMGRLGLCYQDGIGVDKNDQEAIKWYKKAAENGHVDSKYILGTCYEDGTGMKADFNKALSYYEKAASSGSAHAMLRMGDCFLNGQGFDKDIYQAIEYFQKAVDAGNATAMNRLGWCHQTGTGVEFDLEAAAEYYQKAAAAGDLSGKDNLALIRYVTNFFSHDCGLTPVDSAWAETQLGNLKADRWPYPPMYVGVWITPSNDEIRRLLTFFHQSLRAGDALHTIDRYICSRVRQISLGFYPECHLAELELVSALDGLPRYCSVVVGPDSVVPLTGKAEVIDLINTRLLNFDMEGSEIEYLLFFWSHVSDNQEWAIRVMTSLEGVDADSKNDQLEKYDERVFGFRYLNGAFDSDGYKRFDVNLLHGDKISTIRFKLLANGHIEFEGEEDILEDRPVQKFKFKYDGLFRVVSN